MQLRSLFLFSLLFVINTLATPHYLTVVLTHSRSSLLRRTLRSLPPVVVSIDDNARASRVQRVAEGYAATAVWHHPAANASLNARQRISRHHFLALSKAFQSDVNIVLLLEDDLIVSNDFLTFVKATIPLLDRRVRCISGWSDNSFKNNSNDDMTLTTYFPGLGWAIHRETWDIIKPLWPEDAHVGIGWDFWLRTEFEARGWSCITPIRSRIRHIGSGSNVQGDGVDIYRKMVTGADAIWSQFDTTAFEKEIQQWIDSGMLVRSLSRVDGSSKYILGYFREKYGEIAEQLGLWPTPRGYFNYATWAWHNSTRILLVDLRRVGLHWIVPFAVPELPELLRARQNTSCSDACASRSKVCAPGMLDFANDCIVLRKMFNCSRCAHETGPDLPAFVDANATMNTRGTCLITEAAPLSCDGAFKWTHRVCACTETPTNEHDEL